MALAGGGIDLVGTDRLSHTPRLRRGKATEAPNGDNYRWIPSVQPVSVDAGWHNEYHLESSHLARWDCTGLLTPTGVDGCPRCREHRGSLLIREMR